ncbi:hypothetical protein [Streptomyces sp. NPDC001137]|uniref:hypothetical protein n=1 Tax=Streptomyces sp. NPDC001137 TaxID=3154378 RepID=UPI00332EF325
MKGSPYRVVVVPPLYAFMDAPVDNLLVHVRGGTLLRGFRPGVADEDGLLSGDGCQRALVGNPTVAAVVYFVSKRRTGERS